MNAANTMRPWVAGSGGALLAGALLLGGTACETDLLGVSDPDIVEPGTVEGPAGADLLWAGAVGRFGEAYSTGTGGQVVYVGLFTDEFHHSGPGAFHANIDRRNVSTRGPNLVQYLNLHRARVSAENAAPVLEEHRPGEARIAEMYSLAGYTYILFGENYCSGVPYSRAPLFGGEPEFGVRTTTAETFELGLQRFEQALGAAGGDEDQRTLARLGRARIQVNLGRFAEAAAEVASVPTDWAYHVRSKEGAAVSQRNAVYEINNSQRRWSLSDREGGNGIAFRSETDSRIPWEFDEDQPVGFDENTPLYQQRKYPSWEADTPLATGIEARLIEAEGALQDDQPVRMMTILNDLRATDGLGPVGDPGDREGRVDLLFEERARWLFATAHRLGDMRRLVRQYGRSADDVFPVGSHHKGGEYGTDVNFPIPDREAENEALKGRGLDPFNLCFGRDQ